MNTNLEKTNIPTFGKLFSVKTNYEQLKQILGEGEIYPLGDKTSVRWEMLKKDSNTKFAIWDYKQWHYKNRPIEEKEFIEWSMWCESIIDYCWIMDELEKLKK